MRLMRLRLIVPLYSRCKYYLHGLISESTNVVERESDSMLSSTKMISMTVTLSSSMHFLSENWSYYHPCPTFSHYRLSLPNGAQTRIVPWFQEICNPTGQVKLQEVSKLDKLLQLYLFVELNSPEKSVKFEKLTDTIQSFIVALNPLRTILSIWC